MSRPKMFGVWNPGKGTIPGVENTRCSGDGISRKPFPDPRIMPNPDLATDRPPLRHVSGEKRTM